MEFRDDVAEEGKKMLTVNFPFSLWGQLKRHCMEHEKTMTETVVSLVRNYLKGENNGSKGGEKQSS